MKTNHLLGDLTFRESAPIAQPLLVDQHSRIIRWMFKPGQKLEEHKVPDSPFYVIVVQGRGMFAGQDGIEEEVGSGSLLLFEQNEAHTVRALDEELVFVSFLKSVEGMRPDRVGGEIGHNQAAAQ